MSAAIWRGYDRAALDVQYTARAKVPDFPAYVERWKADGAKVRDTFRAKLDVRYGDHPAETLDVFPAATPGAPVHIFFHGGYWQAFTSKESSFLAQGLVPAGVTTVVVNYEICPNVTMTELVRQCRAAVAFTYRHASEWGADPERLTVSGHSAGGHLTAVMLTTDWAGFSAGLPRNPVKAGLAISGLYDLEPIRLCYVNDKCRMDRDEARRLSPLHNLEPAGGRLAVAVGGAESDEFHAQQNDFAAAWTKRTGTAPEVVDLPGHHHFSVLDELANPDGALARCVRRQLGL